jgi:hypothetical protein
MKTITLLCLVAPLTVFALSGCTGQSSQQSTSPSNSGGQGDGKSSVEANLAKLSPEDRKLAEEQVYCAVETKNLLGSMGAPYKIEIEGQPVFLCCDSCETRAKAHAERTLAKVKELKETKGKKSND